MQASGRFAVRLYKEEIEVLLRTPGYAGFSLLDLHDYPTQGTALIGPLDAFWDSKGFITPEAFRRFCGPTVPLLRMPKRTYTVDEAFEATADLAHYGPADLANAQPVWTIKDEQGREVASGKLPAVNAPTGKLTALGAINASLAKAAAPGKLTVTVALQGTEFANDWDIWVYPASVAATAARPDVVVCEKWEPAKAALAEGKKVVFFAPCGKHGAIHERPFPAGVLEPGVVPEPEAEYHGPALRSAASALRAVPHGVPQRLAVVRADAALAAVHPRRHAARVSADAAGDRQLRPQPQARRRIRGPRRAAGSCWRAGSTCRR